MVRLKSMNASLSEKVETKPEDFSNDVDCYSRLCSRNRK